MKKYLFKIAVIICAIIMPFSVLLAGCDKVPANPNGGSSAVGTPTNPNGGSSAVGTPTNPNGGSSEVETPTNPNGGSSAVETPTNPEDGGSEDGTPSTPSTPETGDDSNEDDIEESSVLGDLNDDGVVTEMDLNVLNSFLNNTILLSVQKLKNADVNGDESVNEKDYTILLYYIKCSDEEFVLPYSGALYGDINLDGLVNSDDYEMLGKYLSLRDEDREKAYNEANEFSIKQLINADINLSGKVNKKDFSILKLYVDKYNHEVDSNVSLPYTLASWGDVNLSGSVDVVDMFLIRRNAEEEGSAIDSLQKYINADVNFDGVVDINDYNLLVENFNTDEMSQRLKMLYSNYNTLKSGTKSFTVSTSLIDSDGVEAMGGLMSYDSISKTGFTGGEMVVKQDTKYYLNSLTATQNVYLCNGLVDQDYALYMVLYGLQSTGALASEGLSETDSTPQPATPAISFRGVGFFLDGLVCDSFKEYVDFVYYMMAAEMDGDLSWLKNVVINVTSEVVDEVTYYTLEITTECEESGEYYYKSKALIKYTESEICGLELIAEEDSYSETFKYEITYLFDETTYNSKIEYKVTNNNNPCKVSYILSPTWSDASGLQHTVQIEGGSNLYEKINELLTGEDAQLKLPENKVVDKLYFVSDSAEEVEIPSDYVVKYYDYLISNNYIKITIKDAE